MKNVFESQNNSEESAVTWWACAYYLVCTCCYLVDTSFMCISGFACSAGVSPHGFGKFATVDAELPIFYFVFNLF